jgi:hypothetical protein
MEQLMSIKGVLKIIKFIKQFSKSQHIIYFYCLYIDLDSWKNVLPKMYIDLYIVNITK